MIASQIQKSHSLNDDAIVLRQTKLSETDLICTILTRNYGKISAVAKGARSGKSKIGGLVSLYNHIDIKFTVGRNIDIINEASGNELFAQKISQNYELFKTVSFMCQVVDKLISFEHEKVSEQFTLLLRALRMICNPIPENITISHVALSYILRSLSNAGYEFDVDNPQNSIPDINKSDCLPDVLELLEALLSGQWEEIAKLTVKNESAFILAEKIITKFAALQIYQ